MSSIDSALSQVGSVASLGSTSVVIPIPYAIGSGTGDLVLELSYTAIYAAVAGTTGTTFTITFSPDGGSYSASGITATVIANGAGVRNDVTVSVPVAGAYKKYTGGFIGFVKVSIANADTANAVVTAVLAKFHNGLV